MTAPMTSTYSMWSLFRNCRKAVELRYLQHLVPLERARNLHFGSIIHECLQAWHQRRDIEEVLALIDRLCPERLQDENQRRDWHLATAMMKAYARRYASDDFEIVALEKNFEGSIINPATGAAEGREPNARERGSHGDDAAVGSRIDCSSAGPSTGRLDGIRAAYYRRCYSWRT